MGRSGNRRYGIVVPSPFNFPALRCSRNDRRFLLAIPRKETLSRALRLRVCHFPAVSKPEPFFQSPKMEPKSLSTSPEPPAESTGAIEESHDKRKTAFEGSESKANNKKLKPASLGFDGRDVSGENGVSEGQKGDSGRSNGESSSGLIATAHESKESHRVVDFVIEADLADDKGSRHSMEDAGVVLVDASLGYPGKLRCAHFSIYDGHGGRLAAEYAQTHLHSNVLSAGLPRELLDVKTAKKAILDGFQRTDEALLQESAAGGWQDGATAVCVWILGQKIFVANIGDAKAVVARTAAADEPKNGSVGGSSLKAIVVTREHKAIFPQERARIQKAGGSVSSDGRLQGRLEVSRAFGDRHFKKVGVIAVPAVFSFDITEREQFVILGCDGLWGVFGPSDAVDFVHKLLKDGLPVRTVCRRLVREAVIERNCKDNCTAIIIVFRRS